MDIQLSFGVSKSAMYKKVLRECSKFPGFTLEDGFHTVNLTFKEIVENWESFNFIFHHIVKWSSFSFVIKGKSIVSYSDIKKIFYSLQELKQCMKGYQEAFDKDDHCNYTFWGCHKLKSIEVLPHFYMKDKGWYIYGNLEDGQWKINKDYIFNKLMHEAQSNLVISCPNFNPNRILEVVNSLPDKIDIATKNWKLKLSTQFLNGQFVKVCTGIDWIGDFSDFNPAEILRSDI